MTRLSASAGLAMIYHDLPRGDPLINAMESDKRRIMKCKSIVAPLYVGKFAEERSDVSVLALSLWLCVLLHMCGVLLLLL